MLELQRIFRIQSFVENLAVFHTAKLRLWKMLKIKDEM